MQLNKEHGWINTLSSKTWGIYLIHVFFIDWAYRLGVFREDYILGCYIPIIINIPLRILIVWGISYIVVFIYRNIKRFAKTVTLENI